MKTIYLDLDGTILDIRHRLCSIYIDSVKELGGRALPVKTYWQSKREHLAEETIAKYSNIKDIQRYIELRKEKLESPRYLRHDRLIPLALESLTRLKRDSQLKLVTLRKSKDNLYYQLRKLGMESLLDKVLIRGNGNRLKAEMISSDIGFKSSKSAIVGDTERDIFAGKFLNIGTIAVLSGIRSRDKLVSYCPDYIIEDISQLKSEMIHK